MSTIQDVNKIDLITYSKSEKKIILVMVESREWCSDEHMYEELNEKFNNYLAFVEDGQMNEQYGDNEIKLVKFELLSEYELTDHANTIISAMKKHLENNGYEFEFRLM